MDDPIHTMVHNVAPSMASLMSNDRIILVLNHVISVSVIHLSEQCCNGSMDQ